MSIIIANNVVTLSYWKTGESVELSIEAWEEIIELYEATKNKKCIEIKNPSKPWQPCIYDENGKCKICEKIKTNI